MGKVLSEIGEPERRFIESQKVFFVATAPLSAQHHINVSPKAKASVVLDKHTVAYADLTGSGAETAAHVYQNGRMTLMFCNIEEGPPKILLLFGTAQVILAENVLPSLRAKFPAETVNSLGFRAVYKLHVTRISSSCGYSLPIMTFVKYRSTLDEWYSKRRKGDMINYSIEKNSFSVDGLPSLSLFRKGAPTIEPVQEDGYVHGKMVVDGSAKRHSKNVAKLQMMSTFSNRIILRQIDLLLTAVAVFALGLASGYFLRKC